MRLELTHDDVPPALLQAALKDAAATALNDLQLLDAEAGAKLLAVSVPRFRELARKHEVGGYDLGQRGARWSMSQVRQLLGMMEVKAARAS